MRPETERVRHAAGIGIFSGSVAFGWRRRVGRLRSYPPHAARFAGTHDDGRAISVVARLEFARSRPCSASIRSEDAEPHGLVADRPFPTKYNDPDVILV
jgi:hypothetical protein